MYSIDRLASGGAQRQVVELARFLGEVPGVRVSLLAYPGICFYADRLRDSSVDVVRIPKRGKIDPLYLPRLRAWIARSSVDLLHAFMLGPVAWGHTAVRSLERQNRPLFIAAERNVLSGVSASAKRIKRWIYRRSDCVTVNSRVGAHEVEQELGVERRRIHYLPNGIDLGAWGRAAQRPAPLELEAGHFHVALVGRIAPQKNHMLVLEALSALGPAARSWRVWFVGDGETHRSLAEQLRREVRARDLGGIVRFCPPLHDIAPLLARLDGVILPSTREGFPNAILEAMALRVPVIATAVGDAAPLLADGTAGIPLKRADADELARAMLALSRMSTSEREQMGAQGRHVVESRYEMRLVAQQHLELYRSLAAQEGARAA